MEDPKGTPMMGTMRRRSNEDESPSTYHSISRSTAVGHGIQPPPPMQAQRIVSTTKYRADSSPPEGIPNTFGTLQRSQAAAYSSTMGRGGPAAPLPPAGNTTLQRSMQSALNQPQSSDYKWPTQQEAYASIHKSQVGQGQQAGVIAGQRRGSQGRVDDALYSNLGANYSNYGTYSRLPPQGRVAVPPGAPLPNTVRVATGVYPPQPSTPTQRRSVDTNGTNGTSGVRQSPQLVDDGLGVRITNREQSPYQRSGVKLSSFNSEKASSPYGSVPTQWNSAQTRQQPLLWNTQNNMSNYATTGATNKTASISTSSSQQDAGACFTPTSTLTSQGSNYTPTPGSPSGAAPTYATARLYDEKPRQVAIGATSVRHTVKVLASDSFSDAAPNAPNPDFATSIV